MSNLFTLNPIKINLISKNNTIKQSIIFIGIVPTDVKSELLKAETDKNYTDKNKILQKFYGKDWENKLGIKRTKKGGDEFSFDDEETLIENLIENSDNNYDNQQDTSNSLNKNDKKSDIDKKDETDRDEKNIENDIGAIESISFDELNDAEDSHASENIKIEQIMSNKDSSIKFIFSEPLISVYPEDKIIEFKKKIYAVSNIPIFRQHIWYVYQGRTFPVNYSIFHNDSLLYINVQEMLNNYNNDGLSQTIENIPVSTKYYQRKNGIKVMTNDTFSILEDYYYKYGIIEYNLLDLDEFVNPNRKELINVIKDRYQMELIYYSFIILYWPMLSLSAFSEYIKLEVNISKFFPELHQPIDDIIKIFKMEKKIIDTKNDLINNPKKKDNLKKIRELITNSIVYSNISVLKFQNSKESILSLRNLFDKFALNDTIVASKCLVLHEGKKITLNKSYKKHNFIKDTIETDSIIFKIKPSLETVKTINIIFYKNGNYIIKAAWNEEDNYDFNDILNILKNITMPIIETINSFGNYVLINKKTIPFMTNKNSKFTEIGMSMFYKKKITSEEFDIIKNIMVDFRKAGMVRERDISSNVAEYYFSKGMYQFQANRIERVSTLNNYYDFLTDGAIKQKWYTIFEKTRITRLFHRMNDIKIEIVGVKENEFFIFYNFIMTMFSLYDTQQNAPTNNLNKNQSNKPIKKMLRNLKEQDPVLYNFKKLYKTENVYSKICQKPYQPLLLNKQGYDELTKEQKVNAIKYWNFTTNKDAYYVCPNTKYPYIKFIIKRHPKDYCIPCCKKTKLEQDSKEAKLKIYDMCIKDHKYTSEERTITLGSRYIMTYGKDVEPGRLSRLPEDSLESLFYETYSVKNQGVDQECSSNEGYYMYGVEQTLNGVNNVGILNILISALSIDINELFATIVKSIKLNPNKFNILLNGKIYRYFPNMNDFIHTLNELFIEPNQLKINDDIPWNKIFINIAYLFLDVNIVHFKHKKNDLVKLSLPSYISSKEQFLSPEFKNIIVFKKHNKYFPIYFLNTNVFFKLRVFTKTYFKYDDSIIILISRLVESHFTEQLSKKVIDNINLSIIFKFAKTSNYKIGKLFINGSNMCYYVHLISKNGKNIYIPIELSYHLETEKINVTYEMFSRNIHKMTFDTLNGFIKEFNHWVAVKSEEAGMLDNNASIVLPLEERVQPIYPYITIKNWIILSELNKKINNNTNVIGFVSNNINYYMTPITVSNAFKIKKTKLIQMYYDPDIVNKQIFMKTKAIYDNRCNTIGKSIYNTNLYQLVLLEFMNLFNQQINTELRKKIKKTLLGNFNKDFDELMNEISKLVIDCDDYNKIRSQICEYINNHHNKNQLFDEIDDSFYKFDRELFERIKKLPKDKLYQELEKLSYKFIKYGKVDDIKDFEFPNMFIPCQTVAQSKNYCKDKKIIIDKISHKNILEIMASDILNPVKEKWIFSSVLSDNVISFFKFIRRPDELITIEISD